MAAVVVKYENGPVTFTASAPVLGGRVVKADGSGGVIHSTAGAVNFFGVAQTDAAATGLTHDGPNITTVHSPTEVAVIMRGAVRCEFTADCAAGALVVCAADGKVTPYTPGTSTFDQIVGRCLAAVDVSENPRGLVFVGQK
jgi:hypothetical protein